MGESVHLAMQGQTSSIVAYFLKPFHPASMRWYEVSSRANSVKNNDPRHVCGNALIVSGYHRGHDRFYSADRIHGHLQSCCAAIPYVGYRLLKPFLSLLKMLQGGLHV